MPLCQLLIDQVEFADVIVMNKTDLVSEEQITAIESVLKKLNPRADIVITQKSIVPLEFIFDTNKFDFELARSSYGWMKELEKEEHVPESIEYGISSFVYKRRRPFDSVKLRQFMDSIDENSELQRCIRSKGFLWVAQRNYHAFQFTKVGSLTELTAVDLWFAEMPSKYWEEDESLAQYVQTIWE